MRLTFLETAFILFRLYNTAVMWKPCNSVICFGHIKFSVRMGQAMCHISVEPNNKCMFFCHH